ncbi:6764_t:CDS:1, partial [Scutellospora calospora]
YQNLTKDYKLLDANHNDLIKKYNDLVTKYKHLNAKHKNNEETNLNLIHDLQKTNEDLKKEVFKYQYALGDATSFHLGDQDSDNPGQLKKDINDLHNDLDKFCGLKRGADINEPEVIELSKKYGCFIFGDIKSNKNLISGLLERQVIETIIKRSNEYLNLQENIIDGENGDQSLEMKLIKTTEQLLRLTESIPEYRSGTDAVSVAISKKLRQQIYGVLGNRGFSNMKGDKEHPLIVKLESEISELMDSYRTITKPEKLLEYKAMIKPIIRQVINIFLFRLKVQEPVADWKFFDNMSPISTIMMEASIDSGDLEEICVDVCAFPVIGSNLCEANEENINMKVIFPARIIPTKAIPITRNDGISNNLDRRIVEDVKYRKSEIQNNINQTSGLNFTENHDRRMDNIKQHEQVNQTRYSKNQISGLNVTENHDRRMDNIKQHEQVNQTSGLNVTENHDRRMDNIKQHEQINQTSGLN